jgi:long-chain fatty acid transport protein
VSVHLGGEVALGDAWRVRAGAVYDPSPSPSGTLLPDLPDADRLNFAVGVGYAYTSGVEIDLGSELVVMRKKVSTAPELEGQYSGYVGVLGVSITYRTPAARTTWGG